MSGPLRPGDTLRFEFSLVDGDNAAVNGDSLPTASLYRNGTVDGAVTVTVNAAVATGAYNGSCTVPSGYAAGDEVAVLVVAVVATITARIWVEREILVQWPATALPNAAAGAANGVGDALRWRGTALPAEHTAGYPIVTVKDGTGTGEIDTNAGAVAHVILADTLTTYTGNTPQTGDNFARIGANGAGLTSLAPAATALSTATWTGARAGFLDNLNIGGNVAASAEVTGLNVNTRVNLLVPNQIETPDAGTQVYKVRLHLFDPVGNMEAPDSTPTVTLTNAAGTDRSARLSAASNPSTGVYTWDYTATAGDAEEQLVWVFTVTEAGVPRSYPANSYVVEYTAYRFSSTDRTNLGAIKTQTDKLTFTGGTLVQSDVVDWKGSTAPAMTGDAYAVVNDAAFGNAKLVRSTTPANTLDVSATGEAGLDFNNIKDATGAHTLTNIRVPNVTLTDTVTTYTGNTPQTGDAFARLGAAGAGLTALGDARLANLDATVSSRSTYAGGAVASVTGNVGGTVAGMTAAGLAMFFTTDTTKVYADAVAGSVVKETASNAGGGGGGPTAADVADAVWDEARGGHVAAGSFGEYVLADVVKIKNSAEAATLQAAAARAVYSGTVTGSPTTTSFRDSALGGDPDAYRGRVVIFTSGAIDRQASTIDTFDPVTHAITVNALQPFTQAPSIGDTWNML